MGWPSLTGCPNVLAESSWPSELRPSELDRIRVAWPNELGRIGVAWPSELGRIRMAWPRELGRIRMGFNWITLAESD